MLIAADIGNNRIKMGLFGPPPSAGLPAPTAAFHVAGHGASLDGIGGWLQQAAIAEATWWIASVNRPTATRLIEWLRDNRPGHAVRLVSAADLPLEVAVPRADMVGIDRLLDAVAANRLRQPGRPAVVVDIGSAITVDLVSAEGVFLGGAIAPGIAMSARALHAFTDLLPLVEMDELDRPPAACGTSTEEAMRSGLFWGAVGTIRELVRQLDDRPQVFLTGGAGPAVAGLIGPEALHVPHLTLAGIALSVGQPA